MIGPPYRSGRIPIGVAESVQGRGTGQVPAAPTGFPGPPDSEARGAHSLLLPHADRT
jgi:hypothetical protein